MLYNRILEDLIMPAFDTVFGGRLTYHLMKWRKIQFQSNEKNQLLHDDRLRRLLRHAKVNIPFYKRVPFNAAGNPSEEILNFPIQRKAIIKENINALVYGDKSKLIKEASSGSSGIQGIVYLDKESQSMHRSVQMFWWEWAGYKPGDKLLQTGITPNRGFIKGMKDFLFRTDYVSAYNLDSSAVLTKLRQLQKSPAKHFMGYASSLYVFAKVAEENNINDVRFESVVSWGDKMFPHFRALIEKQFSTRVQDTYACTEGAMIAAQCQFGKYHIMIPQVHLEIVDDEGSPVPNGTLGKVLVTRLDNYVMPLIRYYLGDLAVIDEDQTPCMCGRNLPILKQIIGRDTDIVKTASGKFMVVHAFTGIFEHIPEIRQFKIIQNNLESIEIEYIKDKGFNPGVLDTIQDKIHNYLNEPYPISFVEVESIAPTSSGKPQIIQSFLKQSLSHQL